MKKFIKPEVKVLMVDMTINCMSGDTTPSYGGEWEGPTNDVKPEAAQRGIFD